MQTSGDMFKENEKWIKKKKAKTKTKLLPSGHAPTSAQVSLERKQLEKGLLAPSPGRSRVGELNPRRKKQNRSWNKSEWDKSLFPRGNLRPCLSLLRDKGRPPEGDTLHYLYPISAVLTHQKLSSHRWYCTATTQRYELGSIVAAESWLGNIPWDFRV